MKDYYLNIMFRIILSILPKGKKIIHHLITLQGYAEISFKFLPQYIPMSLIENRIL